MNKIFFTLLVLAVTACTSKFYVGPRTADCAIGGRSECFLIKYDLKGNWMLIAEDIVGFDYEEDYVYRIKVKKVKVKDEFNTIRDGYELVEVLSKEKYVPKKNQQISGTPPDGNTPYALIRFIEKSSSIDLPENEVIITIDYDEMRLSGNTGCNNYFGGFEKEASHVLIKPIGSTKKFCADDYVNSFESKYLMILQESVFLDQNEDLLTLATKGGDSLIFEVR